MKTFVAVEQDRYDELLHKEELLVNIEKLYDRISEYAFRDVVGHLLKTTKANEETKLDA